MEVAHPYSGSSSAWFLVELEFRIVGFLGEGKTGVPGEKLFGAKERTTTTNLTHKRRRCRDLNPCQNVFLLLLLLFCIFINFILLFFLLCMTIFLHTDAYEHFEKKKKKTNHNYIHRTHTTHTHYIHVLINNNNNNNNRVYILIFSYSWICK